MRSVRVNARVWLACACLAALIVVYGCGGGGGSPEPERSEEAVDGPTHSEEQWGEEAPENGFPDPDEGDAPGGYGEEWVEDSPPEFEAQDLPAEEWPVEWPEESPPGDVPTAPGDSAEGAPPGPAPEESPPPAHPAEPAPWPAPKMSAPPAELPPDAEPELPESEVEDRGEEEPVDNGAGVPEPDGGAGGPGGLEGAGAGGGGRVGRGLGDTDSGPLASERPAGPGGMLLADSHVVEIGEDEEGPFVRMGGADGRRIDLRPGDGLWDATLVEIGSGRAVFEQALDDPFAAEPFRRVELEPRRYRPIRFLGKASYAFNVPSGMRYLEEQDVLFTVDPNRTALELKAATEKRVAGDAALRGAVEATTGPWSRCMEAELVETTIDSGVRARPAEKSRLEIRPLVLEPGPVESWVPAEPGVRTLVQRMGAHATDWRWRVRAIRPGRTQLTLYLYAVARPNDTGKESRECGAHDPADTASSRRLRTFQRRLAIEVYAAEWVEKRLWPPWSWSLLALPAALGLFWWRRRRGRPVLSDED